MKIAIVGLSPESHDDAPWSDPEWTIWGLGWDADSPRCDLLFDMHPPGATRKNKRHWQRLVETDCPVYMQRHVPEIAMSQAYPLASVQNEVGDHFCNSLAYPLALAIHRKPKQIGIWGAALAEEKYMEDRQGLAYLIGFARGRGIRTTIAEPTTLLKHRPNGDVYGDVLKYPKRYGYT